MDEIPILPLAMVVIAFLTWLRNRIKETSEIRRARNADRAEAARARRTTAPAKEVYQTPYRDTRDTQAREVVEDVPKTFRELFDEINAQEAAAAVPPPLPTPVVSTRVDPEEVEEAWGDGDGFGITAAPQLASVPRKQLKPAVRKKKNTLAQTLSNGNQLRNALILKEILGPPKALSKHPRRP